ncbi:uncharacterized protein LOC132885931 [Neoarius graeffei]|uniref:uncharacterized protein LOC132885931 n=1 Tax=Neoarius graeffei TaxID=443677 RepID=UPI00298D12C4|nr:uncharacterized protein LOC132885931 [Neoarius graeffei]
MAVERIIQIIQEQGEDAIRSVCEEFKLKMFSQAEIAFLREFCSVMRPVVKALNILQSKTNTHLGWLLPVIFELQSKLRRQEESTKMCLPLIRAIQQGVQKRFGVMMEDPELISAAILLPKFKTGWTEKADPIEEGLLYVRHHLDQMAETEMKQGQGPGQHSSDEEDFFASMKTRRSEGRGELEGYLACVSESIDLLNSFPKIKKLSLKLNTGLPASAACERLFSSAGLLFTAKTAWISATNFENQLLLKLNKSFSV